MKHKVGVSVHRVNAVKDSKPVPRDVMKAAASLAGDHLSYNQSFRAIRRAFSERWHQDAESFQLIGPYLQKFVESNPGTKIGFEVDLDFNLERIFVCPGIMQTTLRFVRPVLSLDACHLRSQWKGTLYVASVKTGCDRIYPVSIMIARENENEAGWTWFLELLRSALEILVMEHPKICVSYKYFSFISDRQKGLINALRKVFPDNLSHYCSIHIARNAESIAGRRLGKLVHPLSKTFSHRLAGDLLEKIGQISTKGREYLDAIPDKQWRSTAWLDDRTMPPRFGIVTSNMSESMNNMFAEARDGSWLHSFDFILSKMMERISKLRKEVSRNKGVVPRVTALVKSRWEQCAGYKVVEIVEGGDKFTVTRCPSRADNLNRYTIDVALKWCECGEWQEHNIPCLDAMAYFRIHAKATMNQVLQNHIDNLHTFENERELLQSNIVPVCLDTLTADGICLPPKPLTDRVSGRPKKERFRRRSIPRDDETGGSGVVCSRCFMRGHNVRTCFRREAKRMRGEMTQRQSEETKDADPRVATELSSGIATVAMPEDDGWMQELDLA